MKERIPQEFALSTIAIDPTDAENTKPISRTQLLNLIQGGFINAQRGLDDITYKEKDILGTILERLLKSASTEKAPEKDKEIARHLKESVKDIQSQIDADFTDQLNNLLPALSLFGYSGLDAIQA